VSPFLGDYPCKLLVTFEPVTFGCVWETLEEIIPGGHCRLLRDSHYDPYFKIDWAAGEYYFWYSAVGWADTNLTGEIDYTGMYEHLCLKGRIPVITLPKDEDLGLI
jgi:hypothetical protein